MRHRSKAELPPSPLDFAYPLAISDATVLGAVILHEVPDNFALHVFQALRLVFAWAAGPEVSASVFNATDLDGWEADVLTATGVDEALWAPIAVIAGELARPADVDTEYLAQACLAVTDWALGCDAHGTTLLFAEAAAVVWPINARLAWLCGKFYRERQEFGRAEMWLKRAKRVAVWTGDWELQAQALNSLGNLKTQQGNLLAARELLLSAARVAKQRRLRERHAMVLHDLFVVSTYAGDLMKPMRMPSRLSLLTAPITQSWLRSHLTWLTSAFSRGSLYARCRCWMNCARAFRIATTSFACARALPVLPVPQATRPSLIAPGLNPGS